MGETAVRQNEAGTLRRLEYEAVLAVQRWNTFKGRPMVDLIDDTIAALQAYRSALGIQEGDTDEQA